jgi:RNA recognition motif-containing protein
VVKLIRDKVTGYPSGYGFLEFPTTQGAQYVLESFNGQIVRTYNTTSYETEGGIRRTNGRRMCGAG